MHPQLLEILRCPKSGQRLRLEKPEYLNQCIQSGWLVSEDNQHRYPIRDFIPRFVPESNYADNFGMQWNRFRQTQLDSYSGHPISAHRFWQATGWKPEELNGQWILDAGCGAGRFAEVALQAGAQVIALDYSSAVDACYANLKQYQNLHVVQGDIYALPFPEKFFPFVYSLGVLQHTPNVAKAFAALPPMVAGGGQLCVDFYWKRLQTLLHPKYLLRPITKRMRKEQLFRLLERWVPHQSRLWTDSGAWTITQAAGAGGRLHRPISIEFSAITGVGIAGYFRHAVAGIRSTSDRCNRTTMV